MVKKYKSKLGEFVDAERVVKQQPILTSTGIVVATEGSWVVRNSEGTISVVHDDTFNKLFDEVVYGDSYLPSPIELILSPDLTEPIEPVTPAAPSKPAPKPAAKPKPKPKPEPTLTSYSTKPKK